MIIINVDINMLIKSKRFFLPLHDHTGQNKLILSWHTYDFQNEVYILNVYDMNIYVMILLTWKY